VLPGSDAAVLRVAGAARLMRIPGGAAAGPGQSSAEAGAAASPARGDGETAAPSGEAATSNPTTGIAFSTDANGRHAYLDPYEGGKAAVAESARNVACSGARPYAITNCLNFGDPDRPEIFYQFRECIRGMADACRAFGIPVISGNVSFYNESFGEAIYPTPTVGMMGIMADVAKHVTSDFKGAGDAVILLGETKDELGGSQYAKDVHSAVNGRPPGVDLAREVALARLLADLADRGLLRCAHDCSDGGLAVCLAESAIQGGVGVEARLPVADPSGARLSPQAAAFSESHGRVVVGCLEADAARVAQAAAAAGVPAEVIGRVGGQRLVLGDRIDVPLTGAEDAWKGSLTRAVAGSARD
jgi:phosphoribosylformylglycinamidine (FGAM) synthase-like enzyme